MIKLEIHNYEAVLGPLSRTRKGRKKVDEIVIREVRKALKGMGFKVDGWADYDT